MADNFKYVQLQDLYLAGSGIGISDTSITLKSMQFPDGTNVAMTDFGDVGYITLEPNTEREENISFTGITQNANGTATLTGVTRGLGLSAPYTAVSGNRNSHSGGSVAVVSNSAPFYNEMTGKDNDETVTGDWTFEGGVQFTSTEIPIFDTDPTITDDKEVCTKKYADDLAISGSPKATDSVYGITKLSTAAASATEPIAVGDNDDRVPTQDENDALAGNDGTPSSANTFVTEDWLSNNTTATPTASKIPVADDEGTLKQWTEVDSFTAGEDLTGATTPQAVYYDTGDDTVKLCDGNDTSKLQFLGFAITSAISTNSVDVQLNGIVSGFTGLTTGVYYYVADDQTVSSTQGTYELLVGQAVSATEILIIKNDKYSSGSMSLTATGDTVITLGFRPSKISIQAVNSGSSASVVQNSFGVWTKAGSNDVIYHQTGDGAGPKSSGNYSWYLIYMNGASENSHKGTVNTITDTGFTLSNTKTGSASNGVLLWVAEGK